MPSARRVDACQTVPLPYDAFLTKHDIRLDYTIRVPTATIEDGVLILELKYRVRAGDGIPRAARAR